VRCSGPCKNIYCLHCATRSKVKNVLCPNRCSNQSWQVEPIPNLKIQFKCPFNSELCSQPIEGLQQFRDHTQNCDLFSRNSSNRWIEISYFFVLKITGFSSWTSKLFISSTKTNPHSIRQPSTRSVIFAVIRPCVHRFVGNAQLNKRNVCFVLNADRCRAQRLNVLSVTRTSRLSWYLIL
jgi:hypothetical protein